MFLRERTCLIRRGTGRLGAGVRVQPKGTTQVKKYRLLAAAALLAVLGGQARAASTDIETAEFRVSYADLDLRSPAGVETLRARIAQAVTQVCGHEAPAYPQAESCAAAARRDALAQMRQAIARARAARGTLASN